MTGVEAGRQAGSTGWAPPRLARGAYLALALAVLLATASVLMLLGRPLAGPGGLARLFGWSEGVAGSRALIDGYSLLHGAAGMLLQAALRPRTRHWPAGWLLVVAAASSGIWEALENTPFMIDRFSHGAGQEAYGGDSVLNAVGDTLCLMGGFALAQRLSLPAVLAAAVLCEIVLILAGLDGFLGNVVRVLSGSA